MSIMIPLCAWHSGRSWASNVLEFWAGNIECLRDRICDPVKTEHTEKGKLNPTGTYTYNKLKGSCHHSKLSTELLCLSGKFYFIPCYHFTDNNPVEIKVLNSQEIIDRNFGLQVHHMTKMNSRFFWYVCVVYF